MKKLLIFCLLLALVGCGANPMEKTEVVVFGAASLAETLSELGDRYMEEHEDIRLIFNFDSSGTLKTQIEEGAHCDIFLSAGQKQMNALDGFMSTRQDILENRVVLAVPEGNPANITSFDQMAEKLNAGEILLATGNGDVPVGQYSENILAHYDLDATDCLTYGSSAKEVTTHVAEAMVDCGILYETDAFSAGLTIVDTATEEMCGQVIYPAGLLKNAPSEAEDFFQYLFSEEADAVFEAVGFTPIQ